MSLGEKIKKLRKERNMSLEDLAKLLNVSSMTVSRYERDLIEPNLKTLKELSRIFNVSIDYLLDNNTEEFEDLLTLIKETQKALDDFKNIIFEFIENYNKRFKKKDDKKILLNIKESSRQFKKRKGV